MLIQSFTYHLRRLSRGNPIPLATREDNLLTYKSLTLMSLFKYLLACAATVPFLEVALPAQAHTFSTNPPTTVVAPDQVPNPEVNPTEGMLQNVDAQLNTWYVKKYMAGGLHLSHPRG